MAATADHEGLAPPLGHEIHPCRSLTAAWLVEVGELADMVHLTMHLGVTDLAALGEGRWISSLRWVLAMTGETSVRTAVRCRLSGIPPKRATSGFLPPSRSTVTCRHARGPSGVSIVALYVRAIFMTGERCLLASVFSREVSMTQWSLPRRKTS